ncbi:MAG: hypothetical protein J6S85_12680 [Methanobrevibacter sp.]|nr:hypothetical protein [Methanobrevibacter sp.]
MSCKYNNCEHCGYKPECEIYKENAELKKKAENLQKYLDTQNCYRECAETWLKLTEAKKLIKELLRAVESSYSVLSWQRPPIKAEAEQFISEVENSSCQGNLDN